MEWSDKDIEKMSREFNKKILSDYPCMIWPSYFRDFRAIEERFEWNEFLASLGIRSARRWPSEVWPRLDETGESVSIDYEKEIRIQDPSRSDLGCILIIPKETAERILVLGL